MCVTETNRRIGQCEAQGTQDEKGHTRCCGGPYELVGLLNVAGAAFLAQAVVARMALLLLASEAITPILGGRAILAAVFIGTVLATGIRCRRREQRGLRLLQLALAAFFAIVPLRCVVSFSLDRDPALLVPVLVVTSALAVVVTGMERMVSAFPTERS